jgi:hypothetical protein
MNGATVAREREKMTGLLVFVYRCASGTDSSNRGVTSQAKQCVLTGPGLHRGGFDTTPKLPTLTLVRRNIDGREFLHAEPVDKPAGMIGSWGGNFVYSSDSRFPSPHPIPVHDRFETPEEAAFLSR